MSDAIEIAKKRYSQQLAAYTLQQFRVAQSALEAARAANGDSRSGQTAVNGAQARPRSRSRDARRSRNFRAIDFAHKAPLVNGTA